MMILCGPSSRSFRVLGCCTLLALLSSFEIPTDAAPAPAASAAQAPAAPVAQVPAAAAPAPLRDRSTGAATDQPPPEAPAPAPVPIDNRLFVGGALDLRYRTSTVGRSRTAWVNNAEVDINYPLVSHGRSLGAVVVQGMAENPADSSVQSGVNLGEAYVIYQIPLGAGSDATAYVKAGRFQVPFALLATYDPHLLLIQPLYSQSLGLRDDVGVQVSGRFYSILNYDLSLTSGSNSTNFDARAKTS